MVAKGVHLRLIALALTTLLLTSSATLEDHWWLQDLGFSEVNLDGSGVRWRSSTPVSMTSIPTLPALS